MREIRDELVELLVLIREVINKFEVGQLDAHHIYSVRRVLFRVEKILARAEEKLK